MFEDDDDDEYGDNIRTVLKIQVAQSKRLDRIERNQTIIMVMLVVVLVALVGPKHGLFC